MTIYGNSYYYFETPDYEDCAKKVWTVSKFSAMLCTGYCGFDLLFEKVGKPRNPMTATYLIGRLARYNVHPLATVALGSTLTCSIANLRGKTDDGWNYFLGYFPAAAVIWSNFHKPTSVGQMASFKGVSLGFAIAFAAAMIKKGHMHDWVILPDRPLQGDTIYSGPFGGSDWGDARFGWVYDDPGRSPQQ